MKKNIGIFLILLSLPGTPGYSQKMMAVDHDGSSHIVKGVTPQNYVIELDGGPRELLRREAKAFLLDHSDFLPGFLQIDDESAVEWDSDAQNNSRNEFFYFRYSARVTSNRTLNNPFIVFEWIRSDNTALMEPVPIETLEVGKERVLSINFWVMDRFRLIKPKIHFMCMGFEVGTSRDISQPITPYEFAVRNAEGGTLADGGIKPIKILPVTPITDDDGKERKGGAKVMIRIDELGYVSDVETREYTEWIFAKAATMLAPFYLFQPRIKDGKPAATKVVVPFQF